MNENFDSLENRLRRADPARDTPPLSTNLITNAKKQKPQISIRSFRAIRGAVLAGVMATASVATVIAIVETQQTPLITLGLEQRSANPSSSDLSSESSMVADDFWGLFKYQYLGSDSLSDSAGRSEVFELVLSGEPRDRLQQLAAVFGVTGEPRRDQWSTAESPSYSIETEDAYISIYWNGTGQFNYSSKSDWYSEVCYPSRESEVPESEMNDDSVLIPQYCENELQPTPEQIPSVEEITTTALRLFRATGLEIESSDVIVYRDQWGASATGNKKIDGAPTALEWYVGWNQNGNLSYFGGHSAEAQSRGEFRTVSAKAAVARLESGNWFGSPPSSAYADLDSDMSVATKQVVIDELTPPVDISADDGAVRPEPELQDATIDREGDIAPPDFPIDTEREVVKITLVSADETKLLIFDATGTAWLVPGYLLRQSEGWINPVISLEEGVIELPRYGVIMPVDQEFGY